MRAWLYYRLSRDEDEEMNSLQNQRQILVDTLSRMVTKSSERALMTMFQE